MLSPPVSPPDVPPWLTWGRKQIEKVEREHRFEVERLIGADAAQRFFNCRRFARFAWYNREGDKLYPMKSPSCGFWFCPLCALRRKGDLRRKVRLAIRKLRESRPSHRWIKLDLTVPNCEVDELKKTNKRMFKAFRRMTKVRGWPGVGAVVGLEVNRAEDDKAHPHFHCSVAVAPGYFNGRNYWSQERWAEEWQKAFGTKDQLRIKAREVEDEEAGDYVEYSQKPPNEDQILWRMRARNEMRREQKVRYYGEIMAHARRKTKAPFVQEKAGIEEGNKKEKKQKEVRVVDTVTFYRGDDGWTVKVGRGFFG